MLLHQVNPEIHIHKHMVGRDMTQTTTTQLAQRPVTRHDPQELHVLAAFKWRDE